MNQNLTNRTYSELRDVIIGCLLGDASLQTYTGGKTWRLRFLSKDKDYIFHLYDLFKTWVGTPPKASDDGKGNIRWYFNTRVNYDLNELANLFYVKNTQKDTKNGFLKPIPIDCLDQLLTARGLAYWYMDDGSAEPVGLLAYGKRSNSELAVICTDSFTLEQVKYLVNLLKNPFDLETTIQKDSEIHSRIYIRTGSFGKFRVLIQPYVVASMTRKL